jgi:50S ribosomal protein L4, bacterial/organelle
MKLEIKNVSAAAVGEIDLSDEIFALEPRADILHRVVTWQMAKRQAGTHAVKSRSQVVGSGKKIVNQKGSGGARHGDRYATQFRGGGVPHGPKVRSHAINLNKKVRSLGLKMALSSKAKAGNLFVVDELAMAEAKTKTAKDMMTKLGITSGLFMDVEFDGNFAASARNLVGVDMLVVDGANVYDILRRDCLVITKAAAEKLQERLA